MFLEIARVYMEHGALLRALRESSGHDDDAERVWREFTDPPIAELAALIRAETKAGRSRGLDPDATARALITMNLGCFFEQLIGSPAADPDAARRHARRDLGAHDLRLVLTGPPLEAGSSLTTAMWQ